MADAGLAGPKLWIALVVALVIGVVIGVGTMALTTPAVSPQKTFTVVAHHWGFILFDEDGNEIPKIEVAPGAEVTLIVIGAEALAPTIHGAFEDRTVAAWENNTAFGGKTGPEIRGEIEDAEALGLEDHSVLIVGYDLDIQTNIASASPTIVTFVADKAGTFEIRCNTFCGWGHQFMTLEGGLVVS